MPAKSERALKVAYNKAMREDDLKKRMAMLQRIAMSICWHGSLWKLAVDEYNRLREIGVTTYLQDKMERN